MAFLKYAHAAVIHPHVSRGEWSRIRVAGNASKATRDIDKNLVARASELFEKEFDPEQYLFTHATIVASVDVFSPPGIKTGSFVEDGFRVHRKFGDFRIKPACDKFVNNNMDAWSRGVLLKAYQTFVGAHNFVEHVQIEELSKGRIIDAVARDIGDSVYIDILIATDRKHRDLIQAIEDDKLDTLSMECTVDGTICTKCGHWAADETELCPHVKYSKGNTFFDEQGRKHRIAELCGHESIDPHGGVQFIEGSWVSSPAFTGAVLRNILEPTEAAAKKAQRILSEPPPQWSAGKAQKAARDGSQGEVVVARVSSPAKQRVSLGKGNFLAGQRSILSEDEFLAGWDEGGAPAEGAPPAAAPAKEKGVLQDLEEDVMGMVLDSVKKRIEKELKGKSLSEALAPNTSMTPNDTIVKEAGSGKFYRAGLESIIRTASSDVSLIDAVAAFNQRIGIRIPIRVYRAALKIGHHKQYANVGAFREACAKALEHELSLAEVKTLLRLSKMFSQRRALRDTNGSRQGGSTDGNP